jgi:hypothetical protein
MQVEHRLSRLAIAIEHRAISALAESLAGRQLSGSSQHPADQRVIVRTEIVGGRDVLPRDDEQVHRRLWIDVAERDEIVVFVNNRCRNLAGDDAAEQAVHLRMIDRRDRDGYVRVMIATRGMRWMSSRIVSSRRRGRFTTSASMRSS